MPKLPSMLPSELQGRYFSSMQAWDSGVNRSRVACKDVTHVRRGVYVENGIERSELAVLAVLLSERKGAFLSHVTAARIYNAPLPRRLADQHHITQPRGVRAPRLIGVVGHQQNVEPLEIWKYNGIPVSSPERVLYEMAQLVTVDELIAIGDSLVRIPRKMYERRLEPWTSIARLTEMLDLHAHSPGIRGLRLTIPQIRVGADSLTETACRLAIIRAGLPELQLQVRLDPSDPYSFTADLGDPASRIAIQYDGSDHFSSPEQQARDVQRDAAFERAGWRVIKVNRTDLANNFAFLIAELGRLLK